MAGCRETWGQDMPVFLCFWHVKRSWLKNVFSKCTGRSEHLFQQLGQIMLMLPEHEEPQLDFIKRVHAALEWVYEQHADQTAFVKYFKDTWGGKIGMYVILCACSQVQIIVCQS